MTKYDWAERWKVLEVVRSKKRTSSQVRMSVVLLGGRTEKTLLSMLRNEFLTGQALIDAQGLERKEKR